MHNEWQTWPSHRNEAPRRASLRAESPIREALPLLLPQRPPSSAPLTKYGWRLMGEVNQCCSLQVDASISMGMLGQVINLFPAQARWDRVSRRKSDPETKTTRKIRPSNSLRRHFSTPPFDRCPDIIFLIPVETTLNNCSCILHRSWRCFDLFLNFQFSHCLHEHGTFPPFFASIAVYEGSICRNRASQT